MCRVRLTVDGKKRLYTLTAAAFGRLIMKWANGAGLSVLDVQEIIDEKCDCFALRARRAA